MWLTVRLLMCWLSCGRRYGLHTIPVVGKGEGEEDLVIGIVTEVEVRSRK